MIRRRGCLGLLLVTGALAAGAGAAIPAALRNLLAAPATQTALVVRVIDGDTLLVRRSGPAERVRLVGVEAPEASPTRHRRAECGGHTASAATRRWVALARRRVELRRDRLAPARDRYGRLLAHVRNPDRGDLGGWLVGHGLARTVSYENRPLAAHPRLLALEAKARARRAGLWSKCPDWAQEHAIPFAAVVRPRTARRTDLVELPMVALLVSPGGGSVTALRRIVGPLGARASHSLRSGSGRSPPSRVRRPRRRRFQRLSVTRPPHLGPGGTP